MNSFHQLTDRPYRHLMYCGCLSDKSWPQSKIVIIYFDSDQVIAGVFQCNAIAPLLLFDSCFLVRNPKIEFISQTDD
jgi:hypothetical protein